MSALLEVGVILVRLLAPGEQREVQIHDGAVGIFARVDRLVVEVHYTFEVGAPIIPRRVGFAVPGSRFAGARHLASVFAYDQTWHVLVENDQE